MSFSSGYNYDLAGNLIEDGTQRNFACDAESRQTSYDAGNPALNAGTLERRARLEVQEKLGKAEWEKLDTQKSWTPIT